MASYLIVVCSPSLFVYGAFVALSRWSQRSLGALYSSYPCKCTPTPCLLLYWIRRRTRAIFLTGERCTFPLHDEEGVGPRAASLQIGEPHRRQGAGALIINISSYLWPSSPAFPEQADKWLVIIVIVVVAVHPPLSATACPMRQRSSLGRGEKSDLCVWPARSPSSAPRSCSTHPPRSGRACVAPPSRAPSGVHSAGRDRRSCTCAAA